MGEPFRLEVSGLQTTSAAPTTFRVQMPVPPGDTGADRLAALGLDTIERDGQVVIDNVAFDSPAQKAGLDWDQTVQLVRTPAPAPSKYLMLLPVFMLLALVVWLQRRRMPPPDPTLAAA